jgi:hypothetical protein
LGGFAFLIFKFSNPMNHQTSIIAYLFFTILTNYCQADTQLLATTSKTGNRVWAATMDTQGQIWLGVYSADNKLSLHNKTSTPISIKTNNKANPVGIALASANKDRVWIAHTNKILDKGLFLARSDAPETIYTLSDNSSPLAKIRLESDPQGGVYALWYDAKPPVDNLTQTYWLWFNHLSNDGKVATPERVLPGTYPLWIHASDNKIAVFSWYNIPKEGNHVTMRLRDSLGKFGAEIKIAKVKNLSPPLGTFTAGNRWFVYWIAQYGELKDDFLIEGAYSDNQGQTWQTFSFESLRKLDTRNIRAVADTQGHIAIAIAGRYRDPKPEQRTKFSSYLITSNDNGSHWNTPLLLSPDSAAYSQAPDAKAAYVGTGTEQKLLIIVEDWRNIRSSIRYWLSNDNGNTWQIQDRVLPLDPTFNYQLGYYDKSIYNHEDKINILIERLGDEFINRTILNFSNNIEELINYPKIIESTPNVERLKIRVNEYGQTLIKKDYQASYNLLDPFYKARVDFLGHLQNQGRISYTTAEFASAAIQGNLATIKFHVIASVPAFTSDVTGKTLQAPIKDMILPMNWLWIDNDWYKEYYSEARELRYTRY